jgi:hypothetical protein
MPSGHELWAMGMIAFFLIVVVGGFIGRSD